MSKKLKKTKSPISFDEFKAWLSGVEDLQEKDWAPSKEQWIIIRDKINSIVVSSSMDKRPEVRQVPHQSYNTQDDYQQVRYASAPSITTNVPQEVVVPQPTTKHVSKLPPQFTGGATAEPPTGGGDSPFA